MVVPVGSKSWSGSHSSSAIRWVTPDSVWTLPRTPSNTAVRADALINSAAYDAYWEVSGAKMRLMVVGATSEAVQWTCRVRPLET